jgi:predicted dehydrogenase
VAGLRRCWMQSYEATPRPVWDPDIETPFNYFDQWQEVPERTPCENAFKRQWELFLMHVVKDAPFPWNLLEAAKGVQLAEKGMQSWQKRAWVNLPPLM